MGELAVGTAGLVLAVLVWCALPLVWIALGRVKLGGQVLVSVVGALTFVLAWFGSVVTAGVLGVASVDPGGWVWALLISASAGLCEETARYLVFRTAFMRAREGWNTAVMHTLGHSGIESVIECLTVVSTLALVVAAADLVPAAELERVRAMTSGDLLFMAGLRVVMGPILHGLFATFVAAAVAKGRPLLWLAAIGLHATHDLIAHRISALGEGVTYAWLLASLLAYTGAISWLRRRWFEDLGGQGG